jgi:hypothetical protein
VGGLRVPDGRDIEDGWPLRVTDRPALARARSTHYCSRSYI